MVLLCADPVHCLLGMVQGLSVTEGPLMRVLESREQTQSPSEGLEGGRQCCTEQCSEAGVKDGRALECKLGMGGGEAEKG